MLGSVNSIKAYMLEPPVVHINGLSKNFEKFIDREVVVMLNVT